MINVRRVFFLIIVHAIGLLFSYISLKILIYSLFAWRLPFPKQYDESIVIDVGNFIGLLLFAVLAIGYGNSKLSRFLGYIYLLFGGISFLNLLHIFFGLPR